MASVGRSSTALAIVFGPGWFGAGGVRNGAITPASVRSTPMLVTVVFAATDPLTVKYLTSSAVPSGVHSMMIRRRRARGRDLDRDARREVVRARD